MLVACCHHVGTSLVNVLSATAGCQAASFLLSPLVLHITQPLNATTLCTVTPHPHTLPPPQAPFDLPSAFQTKSTTPADNPKPAITLPLERKPGEVQPKEVKREESNRGEEKKRDGNTADILKSIQVGDKGKAETKDGKKEDSRKDKGKDQKKQEGDKVADKALPGECCA